MTILCCGYENYFSNSILRSQAIFTNAIYFFMVWLWCGFENYFFVFSYGDFYEKKSQKISSGVEKNKKNVSA